MQLLRHVERYDEFFLPYPDGSDLDLQSTLFQKEKEAGFSEIGAILPTTEVQADILMEDVQWAEAVLFSAPPLTFSVEKAFIAWKGLSDHCKYIYTLPV